MSKTKKQASKTPTKPPAKKQPARSEPKKSAKKKPAAKPKAERYDTPEALAKFDAESFRLIVAKRDEVRALKAAAVVAKEEAADAKKKWELSRNELEDLTGERQKYRGHKPPGVQLQIPFERSADVHADGGTSHAIGPGEVPKDDVKPTATAFQPDAPHADLWRQFPLERWTIFGATASDIKKLKEGKIKGTSKAHPILTVGDLSDFCQPWATDPSRNYGFADIVGLGTAGAERISDAQIRFFNEWNTKGLAGEYARELGVPAHADGPADAKAGSGTDRKGGDGDQPGKPGSAGKGGSGGKGGKGKPKPKAKRRTPRLKTNTPTANNRGDDPAEPFADQPATVPFPAGGGAEEGDEGGTGGATATA